MTIPLARHRLSVADYHAMARHGILARDARVELIDGEIIEMAPIGDDHNGTVDHLNHLLVPATFGTGIVRVQGSVRLSDFSEPEPDLAVLRHADDFYKRRPATPADILLVVEVARSSLAYDRDFKVAYYARHGIPAVWLVDLVHADLVIHRDPADGGYALTERPDDLSRVPLGGWTDAAVDLSSLLVP